MKVRTYDETPCLGQSSRSGNWKIILHVHAPLSANIDILSILSRFMEERMQSCADIPHGRR